MFQKRVNILAIVFIACFAAVGARLFKIQIVDAKIYHELKAKGRTWRELHPAPRGNIFDATGEHLWANDEPNYGLALITKQLPLAHIRLDDIKTLLDLPSESRTRASGEITKVLAQKEVAIAAISKLTLIPKEIIAKNIMAALLRVARYGGQNRPEPFLFGLERELWLDLNIALQDPSPVPGVKCLWRSKRRYPLGEVGCHILGYLGEYKASEIEALRERGNISYAPQSVANNFATKLKKSNSLLRGEDILGRKFSEFTSPEDFLHTLRNCPEATQFKTILGPDWKYFEHLAAGEDLVKLTGGEHLWVKSRGHLKDRRVGRSGIERKYNQLLRGLHGYRVIMRNVSFDTGVARRELDYLKTESVRPGGDITLEIDSSLQSAVERILESTGFRGAAVLLDPRSGAIRALASVPRFDPNAFSERDSAKINSYFQDPTKPLLCRATQGIYPPGSVFKTVVAAAILEEGLIKSEDTFECHHTLKVSGRTMRCLANPGHGKIEVVRALKSSCNIFFYLSAASLGAPRLIGWARKFGFGKITGIDIGSESKGLLPLLEDAQDIGPKKEALLGIGQGPIAVTPLQVAQMFSAFVSFAPTATPHIKKTDAPNRSHLVRLTPQTKETVVRGLYAVVNEPGGTAYRAFNDPPFPGAHSFASEFPEFTVVGKTGTAEHSGKNPHAWFAGFAPRDNPELTFAIVLEEGGHGGDTAAPAMARMLRSYIRIKQEREKFQLDSVLREE